MKDERHKTKDRGFHMKETTINTLIVNILYKK